MKSVQNIPEVSPTLDTVLNRHGGVIQESGSKGENPKGSGRGQIPGFEAAESEPESLSTEYLQMLAREEAARRDLRDEMFSEQHQKRGSLRGPAFDVLLDLYLLKFSGRRILMNESTGSFHGPSTTAARWLDLLLHHKFVVREQAGGEQQAAYLELSDKGEKLMRDYFTAIHTLAV